MRSCAFALFLVACSQGAPPARTQPAVVRDCAACGTRLAIVSAPAAFAPTELTKGKLITPELDPTQIAARMGHPELEPRIAELVGTVEARVLAAQTDRQAATALEDFISELNRLARPTGTL